MKKHLTVMATTDTETISGDFEYKVIASGYVQTTNFYPGGSGSSEFDLEEGENVAQNGDVVCVGNTLHSPYGFAVKHYDDHVVLERHPEIRDITGLDYGNTGALWEGGNLADIGKKLYFLRTKNEGYVKLSVNMLETVPMGCGFQYAYSPTGIFE